MKELIDRLDEIIKNESTGHTEFQIRNFIIGQVPTNYGKYKQCILELRSRIKQYKNLQELKTEDIVKKSEYEITLEDLEREIKIFNNILEEIIPSLDLSKRDELEAEYWDQKFQKEILSYWASGIPVPPNLIQTILSLPSNSQARAKLVNLLFEIKGKNIDKEDRKLLNA